MISTKGRPSLIPQQSSWGSLGVSEQTVRKLFSTFQVFPPFLDVLHAFGQKIDSHEEAVACYQDGEDSSEDDSFGPSVLIFTCHSSVFLEPPLITQV